MFLHHLSKLQQVKFRTLRPPVLVEGYLSIAAVSNSRLPQIDLLHKQRSGKDRGQRIIRGHYSAGGFALEKVVEIILNIVLSTASTMIDTLHSVQTMQQSGIYRFNSVKQQSKSLLTLFERIWRRKLLSLLHVPMQTPERIHKAVDLLLFITISICHLHPPVVHITPVIRIHSNPVHSPVPRLRNLIDGPIALH